MVYPVLSIIIYNNTRPIRSCLFNFPLEVQTVLTAVLSLKINKNIVFNKIFIVL